MTHERDDARTGASAWREAAVALLVSRLVAWGAALTAYALLDVRAPGGPAGMPGWVGALGLRWDAQHFHSLAQHGFAGMGEPLGQNWAFFPGYPGVVAALGGSWWAGLALSLASAYAALWAVHRLADVMLGPVVARRAVWLLALFPGSLFLTAFYSEALFLALSAGAVLAAREDRWALAGVLGAGATLTRATGILVVVPLAGLAWTLREPARRRALAAIALLPAALLGWLVYASVHAGDLLAPLHAQKVWGRAFHGPLSGAWYAVGDAWAALPHAFQAATPGQFEPPWMKLALLLLLVGAAVACVGVFRRLGPGLGLYAALGLAVPLSSPWPDHPLMSLPRFVVVLFPLFLWAGTRPRAFRPLLLVFGAGLAVLSARFGIWAWAA
jgi:hypothetical protein